MGLSALPVAQNPDTLKRVRGSTNSSSESDMGEDEDSKTPAGPGGRRLRKASKAFNIKKLPVIIIVIHKPC